MHHCRRVQTSSSEGTSELSFDRLY